jgi:hypothetical protein
MAHTVANAFTIVREKFQHIAVIGGAQFAGNLQIDGIEGHLTVSEQRQWVWVSLKGSRSQVLTDKDLETVADPVDVCRTLALSGQDVMIQLFHNIDCVQADVQKNRERVAGKSTGEIVIDQLFRLQQPASPKSVSNVM